MAELTEDDLLPGEVPEGELAPADGEAGHAGHDPYTAENTEAQRAQANTTPTGTPWDAAKSWANTAALGTGPVLAGAMGALANAATAGLQDKPTSDLDAYRSVRDDTAAELAASENTLMGKAAKPLGAISTPIPVKPLPRGAPVIDKAKQGALIGGTTGAIHGAATTPGDLTKLDSGDAWKRALANALLHGGVGAAGGGLGAATLGAAERPLGSMAETQALRAAGLRGGIKNSVKKDLGLSNMDEARELGRKFLDEDLIPAVGSSEAVGRRAEKLASNAGNAKSAVLAEGDVVAGNYDFGAGANAARNRLNQESAVATDLSGQKANAFADAFERQGAKTPGSFVGADKAKSDAWKSANFADDAPMSAVLYRKAVGATRDDIERQIASALGPDRAAALNAANRRYGVAADAMRLAENASTRDAAKKGFGMPEILAATTGAGAGHATGHSAEGALGGLALALGAKAFDKYGHSSLARASDAMSRNVTKTGALGGAAAADKLAPYLELLMESESEK